MLEPELPLRTDTNKKKKKKIYMWLGVIVLGALLLVFFGKDIFSSNAGGASDSKTEQTKKDETSDSSNSNGKKLRLVMTGFTNLYSDPTTKTFRTDIKQSEIDHLKKLITGLESEKLKRDFYSDLENVEVSE